MATTTSTCASSRERGSCSSSCDLVDLDDLLLIGVLDDEVSVDDGLFVLSFGAGCERQLCRPLCSDRASRGPGGGWRCVEGARAHGEAAASMGVEVLVWPGMGAVVRRGGAGASLARGRATPARACRGAPTGVFGAWAARVSPGPVWRTPRAGAWVLLGCAVGTRSEADLEVVDACASIPLWWHGHAWRASGDVNEPRPHEGGAGLHPVLPTAPVAGAGRCCWGPRAGRRRFMDSLSCGCGCGPRGRRARAGRRCPRWGRARRGRRPCRRTSRLPPSPAGGLCPAARRRRCG